MPPTRLRFEESQHDDAHEESQHDDASTRVAVGQPRANEEEEFSPPVGHTDRHGGVSTDVQIGKRDPSAQERCGAREKEKRIKGGARREPRAFPRVCVCAEPERTREGNGA